MSLVAPAAAVAIMSMVRSSGAAAAHLQSPLPTIMDELRRASPVVPESVVPLATTAAAITDRLVLDDTALSVLSDRDRSLIRVMVSRCVPPLPESSSLIPPADDDGGGGGKLHMMNPHNRHMFWESAVRKAVQAGVDPAPFLVQIANALCDLHAEHHALAIVDRFQDIAESDEDFGKSLKELRARVERQQGLISKYHDKLEQSLQVAKTPTTSLDDYEDTDAPRVSQILNEASDRQSARIDELASRGIPAIVAALANQLNVKPEGLQEKYFSRPSMTPREAAELALALHGMTTHSPHRDFLQENVRTSNADELRFDGYAEAHYVTRELAAKLADGTAVVADVVDAIKKVHETLTRSQRYFQSFAFGQRGVPLILMGGEYRKSSILAGDMLFPRHERVTELMERLAASLIEFCGRDAEAAPPLKVAAWLHHAIAMVHPFEDGNGRVARFFASVPLLARGKGVAVFKHDEDYTYACRRMEGYNKLRMKGGMAVPMMELMVNAAESVIEGIHELAGGTKRVLRGEGIQKAVAEAKRAAVADRLARLADDLDAKILAGAADSAHKDGVYFDNVSPLFLSLDAPKCPSSHVKAKTVKYV